MERAAFAEVGNLCSEISDHRAFSAPSPGIARMYGSWMERELAIHQFFRNYIGSAFYATFFGDVTPCTTCISGSTVHSRGPMRQYRV